MGLLFHIIWINIYRSNPISYSYAVVDEYFDILMGDKVEPRRQFIIANAQYVKNLDV